MKGLIVRRNRAYSFLEVLISLIILLTGILAILNFFPLSLRSATRAEHLTVSVLLAQMKAEEVRRDSTPQNDIVAAIRQLSTPTEPMIFAQDPRFTYSFASRSVLDEIDDPDDPRDDFFVPRIIIRYNPKFRSSAEVIYELRFDR